MVLHRPVELARLIGQVRTGTQYVFQLNVLQRRGGKSSLPTIATFCCRLVLSPDWWAEQLPIRFHSKLMPAEGTPASSLHRTGSGPKPARIEGRSALMHAQASGRP
jgi:hypothetical protein